MNWEEWSIKKGEITQLNYSALDTRHDSINSMSFLGI